MNEFYLSLARETVKLIDITSIKHGKEMSTQYLENRSVSCEKVDRFQYCHIEDNFFLKIVPLRI